MNRKNMFYRICFISLRIKKNILFVLATPTSWHMQHKWLHNLSSGLCLNNEDTHIRSLVYLAAGQPDSCSHGNLLFFRPCANVQTFEFLLSVTLYVWGSAKTSKVEQYKEGRYRLNRRHSWNWNMSERPSVQMLAAFFVTTNEWTNESCHLGIWNIGPSVKEKSNIWDGWLFKCSILPKIYCWIKSH